jgi:hypothetical protein
MSRKGRLVGAGVLAVVGISSLFSTQVPGLGIINEVKIFNFTFLPYIIAVVLLISSLTLALYISPEEHLWGTDDLGCGRNGCCNSRH